LNNFLSILTLGLALLSVTAQAGQFTEREIDWKLFQAIEWGYDVEPLLKEGASPDAVALANVNTIEKGDTPWSYALKRGDSKILAQLDQYRKMRQPLSPAQQADLFGAVIATTQSGNPDFGLDRVKQLVSYGYSVNAINLEENTKGYNTVYTNRSPLMTAAAVGKASIVLYLLESGADVNLKDREGNTALSFAKTGDIAKLLLDKGAQADVVGRYNRTPLNEAILDGKADVVEAILSAATKPPQDVLDKALLAVGRVRTQTTSTIAHGASLAITQALIKAGANVNYQPAEGEGRGAPLLEAVYSGNRDVVKAMLEAKANPLLATNGPQKASLMTLALQQEDPEIVKLLWPYYQPLTDELKKEWMNTASSYGKPQSVRALTELGFEMTTDSKAATEALYRAVDNQQMETVRMLLEQGADANGSLGPYNILQNAIHKENVELIKLLISKGAQVNPVPQYPSSSTPLKAALATGNPEMFKLLRESGAKLAPEGQESPLFALPYFVGYLGRAADPLAYEAGILSMMDELLAAGNKADSLDGEGRTLLSRVAGQAFPGFIERLIKAGANVNFMPDKCSTLEPRAKPVEPAAKDGDGGRRVHELSIAVDPIEQLRGTCQPPLAFALMNPDNIKALLAGGADVNLAPKHSGLTPLMLAAIYGNPEVVSILLAAGADTSLKNNAGQTAADIARIRENTRALALIEAAIKK
jgi:uncharacterized protein